MNKIEVFELKILVNENGIIDTKKNQHLTLTKK